MNSTVRHILLWLFILGGAVLLYVGFSGKSVKEEKLSFTQLSEKITKGEIENATFDETTIVGKFKNKENAAYKVEMFNQELQKDLVKQMQEKKCLS